MKIHNFLVVLTVINFALLLVLVAQFRPVAAEELAPVLRGRALEIVDGQGRLRASISVLPAGSTPKGETYPETVILRLIDPKGRPTVKITASEQGSVLGLGGETDETYSILGAEGANASLKLTTKGHEHLIKP